MTKGCRKGLRRYFLRKLKEQHEWGWRIAVRKISEQKAGELPEDNEQRNVVDPEQPFELADERQDSNVGQQASLGSVASGEGRVS